MVSMRAVVAKRYGGNEVVELVDVSRPVLASGEVLVEVHAASVNPVDFKIRDGMLKPILPYRMPLVLGNDLAGVVVEVAPDVTDVKPGDEVYSRLDKRKIGAFAEYAAARAIDLAPKPRTLDFVQAASLPLVGLTAWQALIERAGLQRGQKVLIHAGSGGVGTFAIQLAKHLGATVTTTCSARNAELVRSLGADVVVDYTKERFEAVAPGQHVVLDALGDKQTIARSFAALAPGGIVVSISGPPDPRFAREWGLNPLVRAAIWLLSRSTFRRARRHGARYEFLFMEPSRPQLLEIARLVDAGTLRPVIDRTFPLEQAREALAYSESGRARGKVVITVRG